MSELLDARHMLEVAEHAASAGDLATADELLRDAARIQEAALGPLHSELANTLNNLAIVAEKRGEPGEAERFYRRAVAIASASLPADHPMVQASRQNLEDFCHASGLPIDAPAFMTPTAQDTELGLGVFAQENAAGAPKMPAAVRAADADLILQTPPPSGPPSPVLRPPATASHASPPAPRGSSRSSAWIAIGVVILMTVAFLVTRPWPSSETSTSAPTAASAAPQTAAPQSPPPVGSTTAPAPIEQAPSPRAQLPGNNRDVTDEPPAPALSSGAITLAAVGLCRTLSTGGGIWRCDPASDPVAPGQIVLYTRVRSPRDAAVVHHWYRGDTPSQSVKLAIRANATAGYRTYSRQTVDGGADWRVEVRSADGDLLHEQRFAVR